MVLVEPGSTATEIFDKSGAAARASLALADPRRSALYARHLAAVGRAQARQRLAPVDPVARTVVTALEARRPRRLYVAPGDARLIGLLTRLPARPRERLVAGILGLTGIKAS